LTQSNEDRPQALDAPDDAPVPRPGPVRRLYDWTIHWAATPQAVRALFLLALAEASFFPVPPDVLLIAMALGTPRKSPRYAAVCTAGSVLGGILGYAIGMFFFQAVGRPILEFYHYTEEFARLSAGFGQHGFLFIFIAALTPIPFKVFTIAAGVCHADVPLVVLLAASVVGRGLRFFTVGILFRLFGPPIQRFIDRYFNLLTILFVVLLVVGFLCVRIFAGESEDESGPPPAGPAETASPSLRENTMLSDKARRTLLDIARRAVQAVVQGNRIPTFEVDDPELQQHRGAFVTLRTNDRLRGCLGRFVAKKPLWQVVREMAASAATEDPRFVGNRLRPDELGQLDIEISVLSPLERTEDVLEEMEPGKHGIYVKKGFSSGCFLPQVATETGWTKEEFLSHCCTGKAGLPANAWRDPTTEVFLFTAEVIEEA